MNLKLTTVHHKKITFLFSLLILATTISCKEEKVKENHLDYKMVTSDLDNFWKAFDALENSKDSVETIQRMYIDKASPEFKKFLELRDFTAGHYVGWIRSVPNFWKTVRPLTLAVKDKKDEIDEVYETMSKLYDGFYPPDICFAISPLQTGGTTDDQLILLGTEIVAINPDAVDISNIHGFFKKVFENMTGDITALVAHELVHTHQPHGDNENSSLLSQAITEGSADFIGSLILGKLTLSPAIYKYGEQHEKELWVEFQADIKSNKGFDETDWFYNYNSDRPADLGYYLGYKIAESYYNTSKDKKMAVKEILETQDEHSFLLKSNYGK